MHILHIITNLATGGAELMLKRLVASDAGDAEMKHSVISMRSLGTVGPQLRELGVDVEALGMDSPLKVLLGFGKLVRGIRARRPDIVITWMYHADLIGGIASRLAGVRNVVWSIRISDINPAMGHSRSTDVIRRLCARLSTIIPRAIIYVAGSAREVHERLGYDAAKSVVIRNGYFFPDHRPSCEKNLLRAELNIPNDDQSIAIVSVGRFHPQKDHRTFVRAASLIRRKFPDTVFVMIGRDLDERNQTLAAWISESGTSDHFRLLGERTDVARLLPALDIFCLHSIGEGFPNVVAEAMAAGLPCVVTDVGDAAFLVGETGVVVPPSDPEALAAGIETLIHAGKDRRATLGEQAHRHVRDTYAMEKINDEYHALYERMSRH